MAVRVVVGEDSLLVREGIATLLAHREDIEVVELCEDLPTLTEAIERQHPDVVVTDIRGRLQVRGPFVVSVVDEDRVADMCPAPCELPGVHRIPVEVAQGAAADRGWVEWSEQSWSRPR